MLPRLPYLQNAVAWFYKNIDNDEHYIAWMQHQGVIMPITYMGDTIDDIRLEFTDPQKEFMFMLRWA